MGMAVPSASRVKQPRSCATSFSPAPVALPLSSPWLVSYLLVTPRSVRISCSPDPVTLQLDSRARRLISWMLRDPQHFDSVFDERASRSPGSDLKILLRQCCEAANHLRQSSCNILKGKA